METGVIRLIDANELKRDLIDNYGFFPAIVARALEKQPAVDAVPVVRCGKCFHYSPLKDDDDDGVTILGVEGLCLIACSYKKADEFCSSGKRREDDG